MQRCTEGDRKNIRSPANEPVGEETGTSWTGSYTAHTVCVSVSVSTQP